jgi:hypothetical protein
MSIAQLDVRQQLPFSDNTAARESASLEISEVFLSFSPQSDDEESG